MWALGLYLVKHMARSDSSNRELALEMEAGPQMRWQAGLLRGFEPLTFSNG